MGSHHRPTSGYIGRTEAFDSRDLSGTKPWSATLDHAKDLVRIEGVRGFKFPQLHRVLAGQIQSGPLGRPLRVATQQDDPPLGELLSVVTQPYAERGKREFDEHRQGDRFKALAWR